LATIDGFAPREFDTHPKPARPMDGLARRARVELRFLPQEIFLQGRLLASAPLIPKPRRPISEDDPPVGCLALEKTKVVPPDDPRPLFDP
jgi:hypothetical protein